MSDRSSNWDEWVRKADSDLLCIRNNVAASDVPWDAVCFHPQQAAEKMLKAFLVFNLRTPKRTHDLLALLDACVGVEPGLAILKPACERLNALAAEVRYPGAPEARAGVDGLQAASLAEEVRRTIVSHLPTSPDPEP